MYLDEKREGEVQNKVVTARPMVRQVLLDAADIIEHTGWCQCVSVDFDGKHCILGAVGVAANKFGLTHEQVMRLCQKADGIICSAVQFPTTTSWNDTPGRTKEEVLTVMRAAANA